MILTRHFPALTLLAVTAFGPAPLLAFHTGLVDAQGNSVFSAEFVHDYQAADEAVERTQSVEPFLKLRSKYKQPNEVAELELTIGVIYCQRTGYVDPGRAVEHLTNALSYKLPDATYLKAILWRAGSLEQLGKLDDARRDHLRGLLACSYYDLPAEWPEVKEPKTPVFIGPDIDKEDAERRRDYFEYLARVRFQQELMMQRFYFIDGIKRIGSKSALTDEQLLKMFEELTPEARKHPLLLQLVRGGNKRPWP